MSHPLYCTLLVDLLWASRLFERRNTDPCVTWKQHLRFLGRFCLMYVIPKLVSLLMLALFCLWSQVHVEPCIALSQQIPIQWFAERLGTLVWRCSRGHSVDLLALHLRM